MTFTETGWVSACRLINSFFLLTRGIWAWEHPELVTQGERSRSSNCW